MDEMLKVCALCIAASVLALTIKRDSPAIALLTAVAAACVALTAVIGTSRAVTDLLDGITRSSGLPPATLGVVLKTVGISIICRFSADLCRDAGSMAAASAVELAGALSALYVALPLMGTVFQMIEGLL